MNEDTRDAEITAQPVKNMSVDDEELVFDRDDELVWDKNRKRFVTYRSLAMP